MTNTPDELFALARDMDTRWNQSRRISNDCRAIFLSMDELEIATSALRRLAELAVVVKQEAAERADNGRNTGGK